MPQSNEPNNDVQLPPGAKLDNPQQAPEGDVQLPPGAKLDSPDTDATVTHQEEPSWLERSWDRANTTLLPNHPQHEQWEKEANANPTEEEIQYDIQHPTLGPLIAGAKRGFAGANLSTEKQIQGLATPLGIATMAAAPVLKGAAALVPEIAPYAPLITRGIGTLFAGQGVKHAAEGVSDMADNGVTPENVEQTLSGAGQAALGGAGALEGTRLGNAPASEIATSPIRGGANAYDWALKHPRTALSIAAGPLIPSAAHYLTSPYVDAALAGLFGVAADKGLMEGAAAKLPRSPEWLRYYGKPDVPAGTVKAPGISATPIGPEIPDEVRQASPLIRGGKPTPPNRVVQQAAPLGQVSSRIEIPSVPRPPHPDALKPNVTPMSRVELPPEATAPQPKAPQSAAAPESESTGWGNTQTRNMNEEALRHTLGDDVVDNLSSSDEGKRILQNLGNGTHQQYTDLANYLGVRKPKAMADVTGPDWTVNDVKRTVAAHGKNLSPAKEVIARHLADNHSPEEITDLTQGWGRTGKGQSANSPTFKEWMEGKQ